MCGPTRRAPRHSLTSCANLPPARSQTTRYLMGLDGGSGRVDSSSRTQCQQRPRSSRRKLVITGATGTLGRAFARVCAARGLAFALLSRRELDIADRESVAAALDTHKPWALINAAGYVRVDDAEIEPDRCRRENAIGPAVLAAVCAARGIELVTFSSDLVFDGRAGRPYRELDPVAPLNVYGTTKAEAERAVLNLLSSALVIRTSAFFSPWDEHNFVAHALKSLRGGSLFAAADDITVTPSYVPDLVNATLDLLIDGANGVWHLANPDPITWADLARSAADLAGFDRTLVLGRPATSFGWRAPRPSYTPLVSERGCTLPPLAESLSRLFHEYDSCPAF